MKIGIDVRVMTLDASGIGRYTIEMIKAMSLLDLGKNHQFILFPSKRTEKIKLPKNWSYYSGAVPEQAFKRSILYRSILKQLKIDRFYTMDYIGPILPTHCKTISTVYDIIPIIHPKLTTFKHRIIGKLILPISIKNSSTIISISRSTKEDIINNINVDLEKIKIVYCGVSEIFFQKSNKNITDKILQKYEINKKKYILFFGTLEPKKNLSFLLEAYSKIGKKLIDKYRLVLCGKIERDNKKLIDFIENNNLYNNVIFTEFVCDQDLKIIIENAKVFCFPSLYEGFGLPIVESMACGCPVITSNISSMPEIAGNSAILVNPHNVDELVKALRKILTDDIFREQLINKSYINASKFRWKKISTEVLNIILR